MSGRFGRAWRERQWFDVSLAVMGLIMTLVGTCFFVFLSFIRAPVVPYGGLIVALFGLWIGFLRPYRRANTTDDEAPQSEVSD